MSEPNAPPPSYQQATGSSTSSSRVPPARNGIPPARRRSMEDEGRPLPPGWIRQFDAKAQHQFFVDTRAHPPRSIWHHPYDDEQYLSTLSPGERERIEELNRHPSRADILSMSSDEGEHDYGNYAHFNNKGGRVADDPYSSTSGYHADAAAGPSGAAAAAPPPKGIKKFGRNLKDKVTGTTHEERERERLEREIREQREYEMHERIRMAMAKAVETGQPQLLGRDKDGKDVYVEPPSYGGGGGMGGGYGGGGYGYNPYMQGPYHSTGNRVYVRPSYPYSRPYGYGYGGGYGMPLMGGLMGGMLLGGLLF